MTDIVMIRHALTAWNVEGRIQGQTDIPLCTRGRQALAARRLPPRFASHRVHSSPLSRAVETAALLGLGTPVLDSRLMEMHWGEWEGQVRAEVEAANASDARERRVAWAGLSTTRAARVPASCRRG